MAEDNNEMLTPKHFAVIKKFLHDTAGIKLPEGKINMVHNRLAKRKKQLGLSTFDDYLNHLKRDGGKDEVVNLVNALTTNVTHFFRENHHFEHLGENLQALSQAGQSKIVIWSAGCSIGAEPYSIAMTASDIKAANAPAAIRILATDIDTIALARARKGEYSGSCAKGLKPEHIKKYFSRQNSDGADPVYKVKEKLRKMVAFNYLNFNDDPWPMSGPFDFIFCRNALIYFDSDKQNEYISKMTRLLKPGGFLYLGHSEYFLSDSKAYKALGQTIFQKH